MQLMIEVKHIHRTQQCTYLNIECYCTRYKGGVRTRILQGKPNGGDLLTKTKIYNCLSLRIIGNSIILPLAQSAMITRDPGSTAIPIGL